MNRSLELPHGKRLSLDVLPHVMGIVNVTPDSFSDGGDHMLAAAAIDAGVRMAEAGAAIVDVGGESTRPGSLPVSEGEELDRVLPVIEGIRRRSDVIISIDTTKASVADAAIGAGASIVNDVSALRFDDGLALVIRSTGAALILMHMRGEPRTMQENIKFNDVVDDVRAELAERLRAAESCGIAGDRLLVDPGIGFGKTATHNLKLLASIDRFASLAPVVVGASRKKFLGEITGRSIPRERLAGTLATVAAAADGGAAVVRVHDVAEAVDFLKVRRAITAAGGAGTR